MSQGWMRVREAAALLSVSETTVRRRVAEGELRGRSGKSGRQEVFVPAKLRRQAEAERPVYETSEPADTAAVDAATPSFCTTAASSADEEQGPADGADEPAACAVDEGAASPDDMVRRYERLAGGSLVLAQKRADELHDAATAAYENLAHAREQLRTVRKVAVAGWGAGAVAVLLAVTVSLAFGISSARSQAHAQASRAAADQAQSQVESLRDRLARAESAAAVSSAREAHASVPTD